LGDELVGHAVDIDVPPHHDLVEPGEGDGAEQRAGGGLGVGHAGEQAVVHALAQQSLDRCVERGPRADGEVAQLAQHAQVGHQRGVCLGV
jgi:hypothetical protein